MKFATKKLLIVLAIIDVIGIAGYTLGLEALLQKNMSVAELSDKVSSYSVTNESLSSLQASLAGAQRGMLQLDTYYISPEGVVNFIGTIEGLAKQSSLKIRIDSVDAADINKDTKQFQERVTLRINTEGTWAATEHFLTLLESIPAAVSFREADIMRLDDQVAKPNGPAVWKGEFEVTALKLKL